MEKAFDPKIEVFDPFVVPFSEEKSLVFDERDLDACCACTACSACSACKQAQQTNTNNGDADEEKLRLCVFVFPRLLCLDIGNNLIKGRMIMSKHNDFDSAWGAITFLDFLGWKGIWMNDYKNKNQTEDVLNYDSLRKLAELIKEISQLCEEEGNCRFISISDTIVLFSSCEKNEDSSYETLKKHAKICSEILNISAKRGFALRGAITIGEFASYENIIVGSGVDECAGWYEQTDWLGVIFAPSAQFIIDNKRNLVKGTCDNPPSSKDPSAGSRRVHIPWQDENIIEYRSIPIKNGFRGINYCVDWGREETILNKVLENTISLSREIAVKYINTNRYLYELRPDKTCK